MSTETDRVKLSPKLGRPVRPRIVWMPRDQLWVRETWQYDNEEYVQRYKANLVSNRKDNPWFTEPHLLVPLTPESVEALVEAVATVILDERNEDEGFHTSAEVARSALRAIGVPARMLKGRKT